MKIYDYVVLEKGPITERRPLAFFNSLKRAKQVCQGLGLRDHYVAHWGCSMRAVIQSSTPHDIRPELQPGYVAPGPCDTCSQAEHCRLFKLACAAFASFVIKDEWDPADRIDPNRRLYRSVLEKSNG